MATDGVSIDEIKKLPHTNWKDMQGRDFPLHPLYENRMWGMWVDSNGKLVKITAIPVESHYFSKSPEQPGDLRSPFLEFLHKRAFWSKINYLTKGITNDMYNLSTSLAKIHLILEEKNRVNVDFRRMVGTELEYIFITCRSFFDLLQKINKELWEKTTSMNPQDVKKNLPNSFRKMVMFEDTIMSVGEIQKKHKIPKEFAEFYHRHGAFFEWLRDFRDLISHHGIGFGFIANVKSEAVIIHTDKPFSDMDIWTEKNTLENNLGSLTSATCHIIDSTIEAFEDSLNFFKKRIKFPEDIAPGYSMYTRGVHIKNLANLKEKVSSPW